MTMKSVLVSCLLVATAFVCAAESKPVAAPPAPAVVSGDVLEVKNVERYTYLRLKTAQGETWAAVPTAAVKKGSRITIENVTVMKNYQSAPLKKTFKALYFGTVGQGVRPGAGNAMVAAHTGAAKPTQDRDIRVPKASGPNARTVGEVMAKPADFKDKPVLIRGKIVKYNPGIMGKNWIHLRDGTGSAAKDTNDLLVTTTAQAKVGDVVTVKGVLHTDKDFSLGYSYKALVEEATLQR